MENDPDRRRPAFPWGAVAAVFLAALAVRAAAIAAQFSLLEDDPDAYRRLAITLRQTRTFGFEDARTNGVGARTNRVGSLFRTVEHPHGENPDRKKLPTPSGVHAVRPTAYRPPLYPMLLAALVHDGEIKPLAVAVVHALLGAASAALTMLLARRAGLGAWALLAGTLVALDPILLRQSALVMTETLATFLAVLGLGALVWFGARPSLLRAAPAGVLLGVATLCRPTFLPWTGLIVFAVVLKPSIPQRLLTSAVILVAFAAVLAPWTLRNAIQLGKPIFTTTHGGYTLWLANNDLYYDHLLRRRGVFDAERLVPRLNEIRAEAGNDEVALDRRLSREAIQTMRRRPRAFAYATLNRLHDLWRLTPRQTGSESTLRTSARLAVGAWYAAALLLALIGVVARRRDLARLPWLWGILLCLAFTAVHALYWTDMRMRAPLMPVVALAAAAGAQTLREKTPGHAARSETR
jgi:hypothetical protein